MSMVDSSLFISLSSMATLLGTLGFSLAFKDYIASFIAGLIFRRVKHIKKGTRIKILSSPIIKGDIIDIGLLRTTLEEVGDGERLSSINTGRILKVPNFFLFNNPVVLYGEKVIDEVIVYIKNDLSNFDHSLIDNMEKAIKAEGHRVVEVNMTQQNDRIAIHGVFESYTKNIADIRMRILERYMDLINNKNVLVKQVTNN